jgi:hypothetical protein
MSEDYKLQVSPRMLELLSKDLYTNMYFVLAELIANAYDADAENVYVFIDDNEIRVEDDGMGMSSDDLIYNYLVIGSESRNKETNARTKIKKRLKMGRKGVGKLAALSISNGFKLVTVQNSEKIGLFVPHRIEHDDELLKILNDNEYELKAISTQGTAIIMENPKINIPKLQSTVCKNLAKIFPNDIEDFSVHILYKGNECLLVPDEKDIIDRLGTFMCVGNEKSYLLDSLGKSNTIQKCKINAIEECVNMKNTAGENTNVNVRIYGWIGTYRTSRGMKKEINEFSDNYLAIFAHNKMGLRNVLPIVSKNRVYESYIVGNLYIDAFENSTLPDMAATNRQGYNENDPRWECAVKHIRFLTDEIVKMHAQFANSEKIEKAKEKEKEKENKEKELTKKLNDATNTITENLTERLNLKNKNSKSVHDAVKQELEAMKPVLGLKTTVDANKKKIMISQTFNDKPVSDVIYQMLLFNNVPKEDIIYSNGSDPETNLPEKDIYGYLQRFFINSSSTQMIYVLFVTSKNVIDVDPDHPSVSWGELMEIGAAWVTRKDHWIFNVDDFKPEKPLNVEDKWVSIYTQKDSDGNKILTLSDPSINSFCNKIIQTCSACGYNPKTFEENKKYLTTNYITTYNG